MNYSTQKAAGGGIAKAAKKMAKGECKAGMPCAGKGIKKAKIKRKITELTGGGKNKVVTGSLGKKKAKGVMSEEPRMDDAKHKTVRFLKDGGKVKSKNSYTIDGQGTTTVKTKIKNNAKVQKSVTKDSSGEKIASKKIKTSASNRSGKDKTVTKENGVKTVSKFNYKTGKSNSKLKSLMRK